jgi:hypothetical protein
LDDDKRKHGKHSEVHANIKQVYQRINMIPRIPAAIHRQIALKESENVENLQLIFTVITLLSAKTTVQCFMKSRTSLSLLLLRTSVICVNCELMQVI